MLNVIAHDNPPCLQPEIAFFESIVSILSIHDKVT